MAEQARAKELLAELKAQANPKNVEGMARYGINPRNALGVSMPSLRGIARREGRNHEAARQLWASGIHEARILASLMDEPDRVTEAQMERWALDFDSWAVCDQCCSNLFARTPFAHRKAIEWSERGEEFVKRAGFALMAALAVHDKRAGDEAFLEFLPAIERESCDGRSFVRKAVNWALRQIGKRNARLNAEAMRTARSIRDRDSPSARWIAADALRELASEAVQTRLREE